MVLLLQVRERATASLVRKGILVEESSPKPAAAATLHYAAALFDPMHSSITYRLGELGVAKKAAVVSQLRVLLIDQPLNVDVVGEESLMKQRMTAARNMVLCVLARYSDVVDEVTKQWNEEERRQAGERLSKKTTELLTNEETRQISSIDDIESSLYWIVRYFTQ